MEEPLSLKAQAAAWFNQTWSLLEVADRTLSQTLDLLALAQASFVAWMAVRATPPLTRPSGPGR